MRTLIICSVALALTGACFAQKWDVGLNGGYGVFKNATINGGDSGQSADAGFKSGAVAGAFATQHLYNHISGQIGYLYQFSDLSLSAAGDKATFKGDSHSVFYDFLFMATNREAAVRPYVAAGAGIKLYRGTGAEHAAQDLVQYAAFTHTQQVEPLVSFGAGVRAKISRRAFLYLDVRDYLTPFPTDVIAPVPPSKVSGWIHDIVPTVGIGFSF